MNTTTEIESAEKHYAVRIYDRHGGGECMVAVVAGEDRAAAFDRFSRWLVDDERGHELVKSLAKSAGWSTGGHLFGFHENEEIDGILQVRMDAEAIGYFAVADEEADPWVVATLQTGGVVIADAPPVVEVAYVPAEGRTAG